MVRNLYRGLSVTWNLACEGEYGFQWAGLAANANGFWGCAQFFGLVRLLNGNNIATSFVHGICDDGAHIFYDFFQH